MIIILAAGNSQRLRHLTQNQPKSFLRVGHKRVIDYVLDPLSERGPFDVRLVVGYKREDFSNHYKETHGNLRIRYVVSTDYDSTGHGWSLFLTRKDWEEKKGPVLLMHADTFFHPKLLDKALAMPQDCLLVDTNYQIKTKDEVIILGENGRVTGLDRGRQSDRETAGELVGMNHFSAAFMADFYPFMEQHFDAHGRNFNYEPILFKFLEAQARNLSYQDTENLYWMNINYEADLEDVRNTGLRSLMTS